MPSGAEMGYVPEEVATIAEEVDEKSDLDTEKINGDIFAAGEVLQVLKGKSPEELAEIPEGFLDALSTLAALRSETPPFSLDPGPENPPTDHETPPLLKINIDEGKRQKDVGELKNTELFKRLQENKNR